MTHTIPNISGAKVVPDVGTEIHLQAVFVDLQQRRPLRISRSFCELQGRSSDSLCYPRLCLKIQETARIWLFMLRPWTLTPSPQKELNSYLPLSSSFKAWTPARHTPAPPAHTGLPLGLTVLPDCAVYLSRVKVIKRVILKLWPLASSTDFIIIFSPHNLHLKIEGHYLEVVSFKRRMDATSPG